MAMTMYAVLKRYSERLIDSLLPPFCAFCDSEICDAPICQHCEKAMPHNQSVKSPGQYPVDIVLAPLRYEFPVDAALKAFKYRHRFYYQPYFSALLIDTLLAERVEVDCVVPVPLHRWRFLRRGYNQALEIAKPVAKHFELPIAKDVRRTRATKTQSGLSADKRRKNVAGAFHVKRTLPGRHPLIVDDIMTTGHTVMSLGATLRRAGAESVSAIVVARASQ